MHPQTANAAGLRISAAGFDSYDDFVHASIEGSIYHMPAWSRVIASTYGFRVRTLVAHGGDGRLIGLLPLMLVSSPITGKRLVSLPYTNAAGPLGDRSSRQALVERATEIARAERCSYLELRQQPDQELDHTALRRLDYFGTFLLDLPEDSDGRHRIFDKRARRGIAKAEKAGVEVEFAGDVACVYDFHRLNLLTRRKHGVPPQPRAFFERLWRAFRNTGGIEVLLARHEGIIVAGIVLLTFKDTVIYAYGASDQRYLGRAPNHALFDRAIAWAVDRGYRRFDFGRTAPDNAGLMEFKRQWGARFVPMPYYYWPHRGGFVSESEAGWKHRVFVALWSRLPIALTAALGPPLYRHMA